MNEWRLIGPSADRRDDIRASTAPLATVRSETGMLPGGTRPLADAKEIIF